MDTTELRRSSLERKDREQLVTIAKAIGANPTSKARKAEIVDLIIATATADAAADGAADGDGAEADSTSAQAKGASGDEGSDETSGEDDTTTYHAGDSEEFDFGEVTTKSGRSRGKGQNSRNDRNQGDRNNQGGSDSERSSNDGDGPEPGNRRGRRRGRNRDRNDNDPIPDGDPVAVDGFLDLRDDGYGFLRVNGFKSSKLDAYVSVKQVRSFGLRRGDHVVGTSRPANRNEKNPAMLSIDSINGERPDEAKDRPVFDDLTPLFPDEKLVQSIKNKTDDMTGRIIDLLAPIGKGQRGLIVSPPKAGKTTVMKSIAKAIEANNPEVELIVLLVDERPEEVTDMRRSLERGEVAASTFDRPAEEHTAVAELTIERAKRKAEIGKDVVVILDGITRLTRAYNQAAPGNGRIMSGGIDASAIYPPKRLFGAARNTEESGSLTILATALVDTGSKMDEVIYEEFKGTGNMELHLDRKAAERRIYPAIDVESSSTRHEELLFDGRKELEQVWKLRRVLSGMSAESDRGSAAGLELLIDRLKTFKTNEEFLKEIAKGV